MPEFWLFTTDGLQVPVIPLVDVLGSTGTDPPAQIANDVPKLNDGVIFGLTVTVNITCSMAHLERNIMFTQTVLMLQTSPWDRLIMHPITPFHISRADS